LTDEAQPGASWAYDFAFARPIEALLEALNAGGPWSWQGRDSHWYGSYLNVRPAPGVRVRIHHFPDQPRPFSALLEIEGGAGATRAAIDAAFRAQLAGAGAHDLSEIEPYD
jgi:hypothetical protein